MNVIDKVEDQFGGIFLSISVLLIMAQIVLRTVFGAGISGLTEVATFAAIWSVFFVAGVGIKRNAHVRVDILIRVVSRRAAFFIECVIAVLMIAITLAFLISGWLLVRESFVFGDSTLGTIRVPMWCAQSIMPIGGALMLTHSIKNFRHLLKKKELPEEDIDLFHQESLPAD